ncbi:MAG: AAA family ATPase [Angustibacter sp.]
MLTRLEVQGFKNLRDLAVDFGPFTCIAGPNGIGKSNVFDAIHFLSLLATDTFVDAARGVRGAAGERSGDPRDLFWDGYRESDRRITFAAEMLVPPVVEDDLGEPAEATTTFLRYQVQLGYEVPSGPGGTGRLALIGEDLTHITKGKARDHLRFRTIGGRFGTWCSGASAAGGPSCRLRNERAARSSTCTGTAAAAASLSRGPPAAPAGPCSAR